MSGFNRTSVALCTAPPASCFVEAEACLQLRKRQKKKEKKKSAHLKLAPCTSGLERKSTSCPFRHSIKLFVWPLALLSRDPSFHFFFFFLFGVQMKRKALRGTERISSRPLVEWKKNTWQVLRHPIRLHALFFPSFFGLEFSLSPDSLPANCDDTVIGLKL